ncbi:ribosomal protein S18-alanine N-acetyltransferase [Paenibacillus aquistagni]|uniref:ribosomal protein S18-alanine N-acetyltransferase n=1 Tax=Paenibacillus aquistagni TaxID=1852522 RepID=UPI000B4FFE8A|nr:ribosomal protein S18-alanine N-acetyltransferase [Paenibacillus aquistagni]
MEQAKREAAANQALIRPMSVQDIPQVMEVEHTSFTVPWTSDAFLNELNNNRFACYLVLEIEGRIAGYAGMWMIVDEAHVTNIAIYPDDRGHGFGELLLGELVRQALAMGMRKMTLEVRESNHIAQGLYRKFGFEPAGVRKGYYTDNQEDAIIMWSDLYQWSAESSS